MRRFATLMVSALLLAACSANLQTLGEAVGTAEPSREQMARGVKEALELGSIRASDLLARPGGYGDSSRYRISLPEELASVTDRLRQFGLGRQLDEVEALMNRGAEQAAAEAEAVFVQTVREMSIADALGIIRGHDTAATDYFREHTETILRRRYTPIIRDNLEQIGFYNQYQSFLSAYERLPLSNKPDLDLEGHVLRESLDALFRQVAVEERQIREDPLGRGSRLIERVFAQR